MPDRTSRPSRQVARESHMVPGVPGYQVLENKEVVPGS